MFLIFDNNPDPGFRFESLLRAIFDDCVKYGDPWGYAAQDVYNNFAPEPNLLGKRALSTGLCKLIYDNKEHPQIEKIIVLEDSIWSANTQEEIVEIIDDSIDWLKEYLI
jgi:hypothetical protein